MGVGIVWVKSVLLLKTGQHTLFHEGIGKEVKVFREEGYGFRVLVDSIDGSARMAHYDEQGMYQRVEFVGNSRHSNIVSSEQMKEEKE